MKWVWASLIAIAAVVGALVVAWGIYAATGYTETTYPIIHHQFDGHMWQRHGHPITHHHSAWAKAALSSVLVGIYVAILVGLCAAWWSEWMKGS